MIAAHQPTIFGDSVLAGVSSADDGMTKLLDSDRETTLRNITTFTGMVGISPDATNYLGIHYDKTDFTQYATVGKPAEPLLRIEADGIATNQPGVGLFLPIADCTPAIFYDPKHHALMISHLGRHSTEQKGALHSIHYLHDQFGTDPLDVLVWLGPSPNGGVYPLWARDNMSLEEANRFDLIEAGVVPGHIETSGVDTARDLNYFSHSEFLKGHRTVDGRFAIVAQLL